MAKSDSESSSSSSSSGSDSDSSSSSEEEETKPKNSPSKKNHATSNDENEKSPSGSLKQKAENSKKKTLKKKQPKNNSSSSESSSSSSDDDDGDGSSSSASSSSKSSGSDTEEEKEVKVSKMEELKTVSDEKPPKEASATNPEPEEGELVEPEEEPSPVIEKPVIDQPVQQIETPTVPEVDSAQAELLKTTDEPSMEHIPEEKAPKNESCQPEQKKDTTPKDSEQPEGTAPEENISSMKPETSITLEATQNDGEPETKKKKLEPVTGETPSKIEVASAVQTKDPKSKETSTSKRRDRSRSPGRRDRRRSRERDERSRRQRSRTRSRDRRRRRSRTRSRSKGRNRDRSNDRRRGGGREGRSLSREKKNELAPSEPEGNPNEKITERQRRTVDLLTSRTGGAYIPPAKLRMMQAEITDKASAAYQRIAWEALKKSIHGYINKVNVDNIGIITRELLKENIVRGRGLLCRSIIQAQNASPTFTHVYAALVSIINSKFPNIGELLLKRLVIQFKRAFRRNDKAVCLSASRFVAHLVNQRVAHEILALEILTLLVETPTDDSVEVAIAFLKECGMKLTEVSSKGIGAIFEMLKNILHEGKLDKRVQYMIEVVFQVRKDGFKDHQSVIESLELVEEDDQFTHLLMLDEATNTEDNLNAFKFDDMYATNEDKYKGLSKEILGSDASDSDGEDGSGSGSDESDSEEDEEEKAKAELIIDNTETNLIALRRTIYLTINSSLDYEECAHKLMKMQLKPGQEIELCHMFLDCCAEQRTYEKFYGLLAQRFCSINKTYIEPFEEIFKDTYQTTHRLDTNRLRNVSKFFAHLLFTDAIGWDVLDCIKLNEDDTTSSSRIFIKILFQELAEYMGLFKLNEKLKDGVLTETLAGLFPRDNPRNTRFAINFFSSIGLGGLTDDLRHFLKNAPKNVPAINSELLADKVDVSSSSSSSSASSSSSSSSSSDSSSESSSSEDERQKKKKKTKKVSKKKPVEKSKKKNSKPERKKKKSKKKQESSSSESSSSSSSGSSSENSSSSNESSSEDDKKNKKKKKEKEKREQKKKTSSQKVEIDKKDKNRKEKKSPEVEIERDHKQRGERSRRREESAERMSNGRSTNGQGRGERERDRERRQDNGRRVEEENNSRGRGDRRENKKDRSPVEDRNRDRVRDGDRERNRERDRDRNRERDRDNYNKSTKTNRDYRPSGKSRNGSKERG
ncbi:pre-mRNA-splicing factor CWC22 homolog [Eupeodes corollae]|uniref:pre-mRNA-splicing factor CWC22 homolog n=1 Tax=Eupeodes corollae TaxID=290404 RepID=UPI0024914F58|nr:pre-mRNA-splicing factor CWC22 homolog [Eupeodes corollae]